MSNKSVSGSFTGTAAGTSIVIDSYNGNFNITLGGFGVGTVDLQRSFDGSTWQNVTDGSFTADVNKIGYEPEDAVQYRFNCSSYDSGTITYRIGVGTRQVV